MLKINYFLSAGYSKFHWGDGYRGLNLSYASANYPYLLQQFKIKGLEFSWAIMKWTNPLTETKFAKYSIFHSFHLISGKNGVLHFSKISFIQLEIVLTTISSLYIYCLTFFTDM